MEVFIKETGKVGVLALIDPKTGREGYSGFVERLTGVKADKSNLPEMHHVNYHYWLAMLTKEQEGINFIHAGNLRDDDTIHGMIVSDLRDAASYSPIDTINAQAGIIKRLKLGKVIERKKEDGSSSIKVLELKKTKNGHEATAQGDFTLSMPNQDENIDFTAKMNVIYEYNDVEKCVCDENWDFPMGFSSTQETDLLFFLHTALKQEFIHRGIANCLYVTQGA